MADQKKGESEGGKPKGWRAQRDAEGGENSGFDRALQPDIISEGVTCLIGLVGQSTREGYRVLFLSLDMNSRVEIRDEDIVYSEKLSPEESPFGSLGGTRICVRKGATLDYSRTTARKVQAEALAGDEFDLDIQLGQRASGIIGSGQEGLIPPTRPRTLCETCRVTLCDTCVNTCEDTCLRTLCDTCPRTVCGPTCATCDTCPRTACGATCPPTRCNTCYTCRTCPQTACGIACGDTLPRTVCGPDCDLTRPVTRCDCQ
jgi:hypothetical protein